LAGAADERAGGKGHHSEYVRDLIEADLQRQVEIAIERRAVQKLAAALTDQDVRWLAEQLRNRHLRK
jgi:hypothetical protein